MRAIVRGHPDVPCWLCVGDIADAQGRYESLGAPIYWIHGNNDNFDAIAAGDLPADLHHIPNATAIEVGQVFGPAGFRVAGLGGTFAPTWYDTRAADLPHPKKGSAKATELADKRRHFVREEVEAARALRDIDIFLTHEAAKPFRPFAGGRGPDAGKAQINEVLAAMQPRLHLFGHHHIYTVAERQHVPSISLEKACDSYLVLDGKTLAHQRLTI